MKLYPSLPSHIADWAQRQPVFFTGSAPTYAPHINVSPKGLAASHFAVLGPNKCAYIDRTGSGCETIAHSYENGRLCLMFMSFGDMPRILRLFCRSTVVEWDMPGFDRLVKSINRGKRDAFDGARAVIVCEIWEVQTSCGFGVPRVKKAIYRPDPDDPTPANIENILRQGTDTEKKLDELAVFEERPTLDKWAGGKTEDNEVQSYHRKNNVFSMDGLPGLRTARRAVGQRIWLDDTRTWVRKVMTNWEALSMGFGGGVLLVIGLLWLGVLKAMI